MSTLGEYLKELRLDRRMSLRDVEQQAGVSNPYLSMIERGDRKTPRPAVLRKLAEAYDVPRLDTLWAPLIVVKITPEQLERLMVWLEVLSWQSADTTITTGGGNDPQ